MFVCVSTECFPDLPLAKAMERLAELEFTAVEIDVHEGGPHLQPGAVAADADAAIAACSDLQRLRPVAGWRAHDDGGIVDQVSGRCRGGYHGHRRVHRLSQGPHDHGLADLDSQREGQAVRGGDPDPTGHERLML